MKCIGVIESGHSLINFKLFGERGKGYRIDVDDSTAKEKEYEYYTYYTMHETVDAESMFEWLLSEYRPLPKESTVAAIEKILWHEDKNFPFLDEYMFCNSISRLPYFQKLDGRVLSRYPEENEKVWFVVDEELEVITADGYTNTATLFTDRFGKFVPGSIISRWRYNDKMQQWEEWGAPIVYKFQPPVPLLIKRYDFAQDAPWPLESAKTEYGYPIDHHRFIITTGEIIESSESYTASTTAEVIREWDRWAN